MPAQQAFVHAGSDSAIEVDIALYQGGFGSGKTWIGSLLGILLARKYPEKLGLVVSKTYPLLRDTTLKTYLEHLETMGFREGKHYQYVRADAKLIFTVYGSSEILFRSLQTPEKLKSINASWIHIEEASQLTESDFLMLLSRLRGNVPRLRLFAHTNPQANKDWIWQYFVARKTQTARIQYRRIIAPSTENIHLPPGYLENMATQYGAAYYKMNVLGQDGEATEGLVCKSWSEANVDRALRYDPEQVLYLSCDFNVDPMCWVIAHRVLLPGNMSQYEFIDELCISTYTPSAQVRVGYSGTTYTLKGILSQLVFYDRILNASELRNSWLSSKSVKNMGSPLHIVMDGDSQTVGTPASFIDYARSLRPLLSYGRIYQFYQDAISGQTLTNMESGAVTADTGIDALTYLDPAPSRMLIIWGGTNDIATGSNAATTYSNLVSYITNRKATNNFERIVSITAMPRFNTATTTTTFSYDDLQIAGLLTGGTLRAAGCDTIIDLRNLPQFDADGDYNDTTYFNVDKIHLTQAGYNVIAPYIKQVLNFS